MINILQKIIIFLLIIKTLQEIHSLSLSIPLIPINQIKKNLYQEKEQLNNNFSKEKNFTVLNFIHNLSLNKHLKPDIYSQEQKQITDQNEQNNKFISYHKKIDLVQPILQCLQEKNFNKFTSTQIKESFLPFLQQLSDIFRKVFKSVKTVAKAFKQITQNRLQSFQIKMILFDIKTSSRICKIFENKTLKMYNYFQYKNNNAPESSILSLIEDMLDYIESCIEKTQFIQNPIADYKNKMLVKQNGHRKFYSIKLSPNYNDNQNKRLSQTISYQQQIDCYYDCYEHQSEIQNYSSILKISKKDQQQFSQNIDTHCKIKIKKQTFEKRCLNFKKKEEKNKQLTFLKKKLLNTKSQKKQVQINPKVFFFKNNVLKY